MQAESVGPSRSGRLGATARRMIDGSSVLHKVVKSEPGQRIVQALRAAPHIQSPGRFLLGSLLSPTKPAVYSVRGLPTRVVLRHRTNDVLAFNEVFHRRAYALPLEVAECLRDAGRQLRVVDLGANVGLFSAWAFATLSVSEIDAYEPDAQNAEVLRRMIAVNAFENRMRLHEACAGVASGVVRFAGGDFIHSRVVEDDALGTVELQQDDVMGLLGIADLIKIDIEGSEWPILADARWPQITALAVAMEWHLTDTAASGEEQATGALERAGLTVVHSYSEEPSCGVLWAVRRDEAYSDA
jgi:FkbM family methyltransferase